LELEDASRAGAGAGGAGRAATVRSLFTGGYARNTLPSASRRSWGLLLSTGLNNWLPTIMREAGYDLGDSLAFLLVLNVGAIVGLLVAGDGGRPHRRPHRGGDLVRLRRGLPGAAVGGAAHAGLYLMCFLTGCFVFSAGARLRVHQRQQRAARARRPRWAGRPGAGRIGAIVGPVITGALVTAGIAYPWGFYLFAVVGVLGAVALRRHPARRRGARPPGSPAGR
jgi:hypothetical protein